MNKRLNSFLLLALVASLALNMAQCSPEQSDSYMVDADGKAIPLTKDRFPIPGFMKGGAAEMKEFIASMFSGKGSPPPVEFPELTDTVRFQVYAYDQWLKLLPDAFYYNSRNNTINYISEKVEGTDNMDYVKELVNAYVQASNRTGVVLPRTQGGYPVMKLAPHGNVTSSYFIHWEDLEGLKGLAPNAEGIRFYNSMDYTAMSNESSQGITKGFVVPADPTKDHIPTTRPSSPVQNEGGYVGDLILPCPATCPEDPIGGDTTGGYF